MSSPPQPPASLPALNTTAGGKGKYSLDASSRNPDATRRAQQYVTNLANTAPASGAAERPFVKKRNKAVGFTTAGSAAGFNATMPAQPAAPYNEGGVFSLPPSSSPTTTAAPAPPPLHRSTTPGPFALSPAQSYVAARKEATAENWRSSLLHLEADLRELVSINSTSLGEQPPSTARTVRAIKIYDAVCRACEEQSPNLAELMRLFRIEFCRAIFSNVLGFGGDATAVTDKARLLADPLLMEQIADEDVTTYFDQVDTLVRDNAALSAEVATGNTRARIVELTREVEDLNERILVYDNELGRLSRQSDKILGQCSRAREALDAARIEHARQAALSDKELQALHAENKDLQLQLFRLRKQVAGGKTKQLKDAYQQMKDDKMQMLTTLFSEGDERMNILVMISQLEARINEALDRYDNDFMLAPEHTHEDLRRKMCDSVMCLLEEMHLCECNYRRLTPDRTLDPTSEETDETDGYVAILFDKKIYENLLMRDAIRDRLQAGAELMAQQDQEGDCPVVTVGSLVVRTGSGGPQTLSLETSNASPPRPTTSIAEVLEHPAASFERAITQAGVSIGRMSDIVLPSSLSQGRLGSPDASKAGATVGHQRSPGGSRPATAGRSILLEDLVFLKRAEWIERIFTPPPQERMVRNLRVRLLARRAQLAADDPVAADGTGRALTPMGLMPRLLRHPLHDISGAKFMSAVEIFCGRDLVQQQRLCTITHVDPAMPVQLPERTNFIKVKYRSSHALGPGASEKRRVTVLTGAEQAEMEANQSQARDGDQGGGGRGVEAVSPGAHAEAPSGDDGFFTPRGTIAAAPAAAGAGGRGTKPSVAFHVSPTAGRHSINADPSTRRTSAAAQQSRTATRVAVTSATRTSGYAVGGPPVTGAVISTSLKDWGGNSPFEEESAAFAANIFTDQGAREGDTTAEKEDIFRINENLRVFRELTNPVLLKGGRSGHLKAGATSSTTATTVAFQRLNPLSPNRGPEWTLYKSLFGSFRSLTPRMIEVTTIDHILMCSTERHYSRMEHRYDECLREASQRATNTQMTMAMAERFFREAYALTDFQEALVDELEARYCLPELVAKTMYEVLCYLDATSHNNDVLALYLNVIRGFQPPTHLHYISYMLFHLSYCWPTSNPLEEISRDDATTVLRYLYRDSGKIVHVDVHETLRDYEMTTRTAPLTFVAMRRFLAATMMHQEESILLYLNGLFTAQCDCDSLDHLNYDNYEEVATRNWQPRAERKSVIRFLTTGLGLDRGPLLSVRDFAAIASSEWCSNLWQ